MSDQRASIPYDRYRAEAHALRSAAYGDLFRRLRRLLVRRPRRAAQAPTAPAWGQ